MFEVDVTVQCNVPFKDSELHLISSGRISGGIEVVNFFTPSVKTRSFPFQRLAFVQHKDYRIFDECRDQDGYLAIHRAAEGGNSDAIRWFINVGVDTSLKTTFGLTALDLSLFHLENGKELSLISLIDEVPLHATFNTQRVLVLKELLAQSLKAINYNWHSSWCNPKLDKLSPLHIAATKGFHELGFVYEKAQTIVPDLSLDCYNKDGVGPLYLAYFYESLQDYSTILETGIHKIRLDRVSLRYPDREVEYQIIYNRFYKAPTYFPFDVEREFRLYVDEITNCPGFYDLVPNKQMLDDRNDQCLISSLDSAWFVDILKVLPVYLHNKFYRYYKNGYSYEPLWFLRTMQVYNWVKYHLQKRSPILVWLRVWEKLKYHKHCYCFKIMRQLQLTFTSHPRNVEKVDKFTWERMDWAQNSTLDEEKRRWPFYFLFKKAMGEYKSHEYLKILNKGLDLIDNAFRRYLDTFERYDDSIYGHNDKP